MITRAQSFAGEPRSLRRRQWLIEGTGGSPKLVSGAAEVRDLLDQGRITAESRVYEITEDPRPLRDVSELGYVIVEPLSAEPPVREHTWSAERVRLSEELAILDRPLENDVEYFDEPGPSRWRGVKLVVLAFVMGAIGYGAFPALKRSPSTRDVGTSETAPMAIAARVDVPAAPAEVPAAPVAAAPVTVPAAPVETAPTPALPDAAVHAKHKASLGHHASRHSSRRH